MGIDISFIIPIYNKEPYIRRCIESVREQDLPSYEIIIIDDASTDNSFDVIKEYKRYDNICIKKNTENRGLAYSRNLGLKHAQGKYVWFIDADDYIKNGTAKKILDIAISQKLDVIYFNMCREGRILKLANIEQTDIISGEKLFCMIGKDNTLRASVCGQIYCLEYIRQNNFRFTEGMMAEDAYFSIRALLMASRAMYLPCDAYVYTDTKNSITYNTPDYEYFIGTFNAYCEIREFWESIDGKSDVKKYMAKIIGQYYRIAKEHFRIKNWKKIQKWAENRRLYIYNQYLIFESTEIIKRYVTQLNDEQIKRINSSEELIVYGAGKVAQELSYALHSIDKKIKAYAVTNVTLKRKSWYGVPIVPIHQLLKYKDRALVIVATTDKYYDDINSVLQKYDFQNIMWLFR